MTLTPAKCDITNDGRAAAAAAGLFSFPVLRGGFFCSKVEVVVGAPKKAPSPPPQGLAQLLPRVIPDLVGVVVVLHLLMVLMYHPPAAAEANKRTCDKNCSKLGQVS